MATGLLALLDDIATILDDVALMTKVAAKKTAGVLGDDLALNAEQVTGVRADRELPVVWAVALGSLKNKCILVPAALLISAFIPWLIIPLLMLGGAFLCFEGFEKLVHKFTKDDEHKKEVLTALHDPNISLEEFEKDKIKGAIRTDFILSAEIVVITLGTVQESSLAIQIGVVAGIALVMTIGVYGVVAGIVKLDDLGLFLIKKADQTSSEFSFKRSVGKAILAICPYILKTLTIVGTAAMFLVGGGILLHGLPISHELIHWIDEMFHGVYAASFWSGLAHVLINAVTGIVAGAVILLVVNMINRKKSLAH
ncbi:DUF808 domain-containing protein [Sessilibacter sp. MAH2]